MTSPGNGSKLLNLAMIVPKAQTRVLSLRYQAELYEAFHQDWRSQLLHALFTVPAMVGFLVLLACIPVGFEVNLIPGFAPANTLNVSFLGVMVLLAWYAVFDRWVALFALPFLVGAWLLANWVVLVLGSISALYAAGVVFACGAIQALSHYFEDVPPPLSGSESWADRHEWWSQASFKQVATIGIMFPMYSTLELISIPRIFPLQILRLLHRFGYRSAFAEEVKREALSMLYAGREDVTPATQ
ncbi:MAG: hypothetical protein EP343_00060 [Deltaproteobacteria bacterium]|nr:MAG: hypothetical protein EP343_00060 [Deltaproteobacteria bacterium]